MTDTQTQNQAILAWLELGRSLTPLDAFQRFGTMRLGARVFELRRMGWQIDSRLVRTATGKRVAQYSLMGERERASRAAIA